MTRPEHYPIRAVSRMTGLGPDTLRAWERRYRAVVPVRNDRGRVYSDRHVQRLKQLAALVADGHPIGSIAGLPDAALRRLRSGHTEPAESEPIAIDLSPLVRAMQQYDLASVESIVNRHALLLPPADVIFHVVLPVLRETGKRWRSGTIRPAQEHLMSAIFRAVLGGLLRSLPAPASAMRMVFATPAGERHELGLLCGAVLAACAGFQVVYLGPDLPAADIRHAVQTTAAKVLVLATTAEDVTAPDELRGFKRLPEAADLWIGGAQADAVRSALGSRARKIDSLEDLRTRLDRYGA